MESSKLLLFSAATAVALLAGSPLLQCSAAPGIFDVFSWGLDQIDDPKVPGVTIPEATRREDGNAPEKKCVCDGSQCRCCVDLSVAIDIGGPACVDMRYVSQEAVVKMNISYGDSLLHGAQIRSPKTPPICMDVLSDLVQVCASMRNFRREGTGLFGCAILEPTLLGDVQHEYQLGCFLMDPEGMKLQPQEEEEETTTTEFPEAEHETVKPEINEEAIIAAVNESAEEGIAWFSSLLGLSFGGNQKNFTAPPQQSSPVSPSLSASSSSQPSSPSHLPTSIPLLSQPSDTTTLSATTTTNSPSASEGQGKSEIP